MLLTYFLRFLSIEDIYSKNNPQQDNCIFDTSMYTVQMCSQLKLTPACNLKFLQIKNCYPLSKKSSLSKLSTKIINECNTDIPIDFSLVIESAFMISCFHKDQQSYKKIFILPTFSPEHYLLNFFRLYLVCKITFFTDFYQSERQ